MYLHVPGFEPSSAVFLGKLVTHLAKVAQTDRYYPIIWSELGLWECACSRKWVTFVEKSSAN